MLSNMKDMDMTRILAALAAVLMACVPAVAQNVAKLPNAAALTGTEGMTAVQGSGCLALTTPCATVKITPAQIGTYLGATFQPIDGDLTSIAAATGANTIYYRSAANTWSPVTIGTNLSFSGGTLASTASGGTGTVTGVTGTAPIVSSGGTVPAISITAATASVPGSMSAADKSKLDGIASGATANTGTVTSFAFTNGAGVAGTVANASTTPTLSLTLGAITPTSVAATGAVTGSNLSGTNTGDQTSVSGNAGTATKLATGRTLAITGDLAWTSPTFDGSGNVTATGTLATSGVTAGSCTACNLSIDAKGRVTAQANGSSGTVSSVSVTSVNGVSGAVANASTTPAISITLGAITPASVASSGAISGSSGAFGAGFPVNITGDANGNMAVGSGAGGTGGSNSNNVVVGLQALQSATSASSNLAFGFRAGRFITGASSNTLVGTAAGGGMTTGTGNVLVGYTVAGNFSGGETNNTVVGAWQGAAGIASNVVLADGQGTARYRWDGTSHTFTGGGLVAGTIQASAVSTVAALPTCNAGARGTRTVVTDATSPTFLGNLTGGGAVVAPAFCNGSSWVAG